MEVVPARGLGSATLVDQVRELVALSLGGRTDRPIYHVHCDPEPAIRDNAAARSRWWALFEAEFDLTGQPYCGAVHLKEGRRHEHRVYGLVRPSGRVVDLAWDYPRREKCSRIVEFEFGMPPVPSKHARAIARRLRQDGRSDVADWLVAAGATEAERPIAPLTPAERLGQERTGIDLDDVRRATLAAWRASEDGSGFVAALRARGLDLRQGRKGPVVVDASGAAHLATRLVGAASRRFEGRRIVAATVKARLSSHEFEDGTDAGSRSRAKPGEAGAVAPRDPGGSRAAGDGGGLGVRRFGGCPDRVDRGGGGRDPRGPGAALRRLRALPAVRRAVLRRRLTAFDPTLDRHLAALERVRAAAERIEAEAAYERERAWALWGFTDIWGLPLT
ncbi:hypothetical protein [Methylobacterium sp. Leaf87]|uniref:hypothetical protein n=1 Tax=Methylobacterium sp. Leaf87 TaxID=1736243 RepID=UPI001FCCCB35|nr:hypothetical protein [Methylobacterium sp. Leaf87]